MTAASTQAFRRIGVFSGSSLGVRPTYLEHARQLGQLLAERGIGLVYGGASVGLMGAIADATLAAGGEVIGVIPENLVAKELAHSALTGLHVVGSMHERKALMAELSDGFIALPGGFGTFEEFFEIVTWAQLGLHGKPIGLLNSDRYYDPLLSMVSRAVDEGFIRSAHAALIVAAGTPEALLETLARHEPPRVPKWLTRKEET